MKKTLFLLVMLGLSWSIQAQEGLPDAPSASKVLTKSTVRYPWQSPLGFVKKPFSLQRETTLYKTLYSIDGALRAADGYTTYKFLSDPCKCFHEADPLAPKSSNPVAIGLFQASALMAVTQGHNLLVAHGHKKLAHILLWADLGSEAFAVVHNSTLAPDSAQRTAIINPAPLTYKPLH